MKRLLLAVINEYQGYEYEHCALWRLVTRVYRLYRAR